MVGRTLDCQGIFSTLTNEGRSGTRSLRQAVTFNKVCYTYALAIVLLVNIIFSNSFSLITFCVVKELLLLKLYIKTEIETI